MANLRGVNYHAVGCEGEKLDLTLQELNAAGWSVRQIFQEPPNYYRIFAQREPDNGITLKVRKDDREISAV